MRAAGAPQWHVAQWIGARRRQEDSWKTASADDGTSHLVVVADGMGGEAGGDIASRLAVTRFAEAYLAGAGSGTPPERLRAALAKANDALLAEVEGAPDLEGMGTTLVAVAAEPDGYYHISVGDTLLWRVEAEGLVRINEDHSMRGALAAMVESGRISADRAARHPARNQLRSVLGEEDLDLIDCPSEALDGKASMLLIATDGIETLGEDEIHAKVTAAHGDPRRAAEALVEAVEARGAPRQDNVTVCVWRIGARAPVARPGGVRRLPLLAGLVLVAAAAALAALLLTPRWLGREAEPAGTTEAPARTNPPTRDRSRSELPQPRQPEVGEEPAAQPPRDAPRAVRKPDGPSPRAATAAEPEAAQPVAPGSPAPPAEEERR
jgi:serine/threonine protein phosphatase PrpC